MNCRYYSLLQTLAAFSSVRRYSLTSSSAPNNASMIQLACYLDQASAVDLA